MDHSEYVAYFRDIAERQGDLLHSDENKRFARVIYSEWPSPSLQLGEFLSLHKADLQYPFMLCETWVRKTNAHSSEHLDNIYKGSFFIGDLLPDKHDFDALDVLLDKTDRIADEIQGYMLEEFEAHLNSANAPKRYLIEGSFQLEHIGPFNGDKYGTRCEFQYRQSASRWDKSNLALSPNTIFGVNALLLSEEDFNAISDKGNRYFLDSLTVFPGVFLKGAALTDITGLSMSNNNQKAYEGAVLSSMIFSADQGDDSFSLDDSNVPEGMVIEGKELKMTNISAYLATVALGNNSFEINPIPKDGFIYNGDPILVTITKEALYDPSDLVNSEAQNWYSAMEVVEDSEDVSTYLDKTANNEDVTIRAGSTSAYLKSNFINGRNAVLHPSNGEFENTDGVTSSSDFWVFCLVKLTPTGGNARIFRSIGDNGNNEIYVSRNQLYMRQGGTLVSINLDEKSFYDKPQIISGHFNGANSALYIAGELIASPSLTASGLAGSFYLAGYGSIIYGLCGYMLDFFIVDVITSFTEDDRQDMEGYLNALAGGGLLTLGDHMLTPRFR